MTRTLVSMSSLLKSIVAIIILVMAFSNAQTCIDNSNLTCIVDPPPDCKGRIAGCGDDASCTELCGVHGKCYDAPRERKRGRGSFGLSGGKVCCCD
ncbi:hypothetical protein Lal_00003702 [Lupinus albus]|nr:hypothetical protein Lal_00003702 [Lupinus albus]